MGLHKLFEDQIEKSKKYVKLQAEGVSQIDATYKAFGVETGDAMVSLLQDQTIARDENLTKINNN